MMIDRFESLGRRAQQVWGKIHLPPILPTLNNDDTLLFAMRSNGWEVAGDGSYTLSATSPESELNAERVAFFGPQPQDLFFQRSKRGEGIIEEVLNQGVVLDSLDRLRGFDQQMARRVAFLYGGLARHHFLSWELERISDAAGFIASMTQLTNRRSAEAVASAMTLYVISGGSLEGSVDFREKVLRMAQAVEVDPVFPTQTKDLGLSQVARLAAFQKNHSVLSASDLLGIREAEASLDGFPTIGAEFHLPLTAAEQYPNLWRRLAITNISQHRRGSHIQLSRNDCGVIEVRMNPSTFPVAIGNWEYLRQFLPELNQSFFTLTLAREGGDFNWDALDTPILNSLSALGRICYATQFSDIPPTLCPDGMPFGNHYLGQTVRVTGLDTTKLSGDWSRGEGKHGQLGLYTGYGDLFPYLAHFMSLAVVKPDLLKFADEKGLLPKTTTLQQALGIDLADRRELLNNIQSCAERDGLLKLAQRHGYEILQLLRG